MIERELINGNSLRIIGTVTNVECNVATSASNKDYCRGKVTLNVKDKSIDVNFFTMKITKDGNVSKLYNTYTTLDSYIGKRVEVTGGIDDSIIVKDNTPKHVNTLSLRFINVLKDGDAREDSASYEVEGFIYKGLTAVYDRNDSTKIIDYQLQLAQSNYNKTSANILTFHVDPSNTAAVNAIDEKFLVGTTVKLNGNLDFNVETIEKVIENDFGPNTTKTMQRSHRRYPIISGSIVNDEALQYSESEISELLNGTKELENAQLNKRTESSTATPVQTKRTGAAKLI